MSGYFEDLEGEWETAVDKRKVNRAVRRDRKQAESQSAGAALVGGDVTEEFDAAERKKRAAASFYGEAVTKAQQRAKKTKQQRGAPEKELEFEDAGWAGSILGDQKKKSKKAKTTMPTYETADDLYEALADLLARVPPTAGSSATATLASLGDKLATVTKQPWNKKFKGNFGTMRKFLEGRPSVFAVEGDNVSLVKTEEGAKANKSKAKKANSSGAAKQEQEQGEDSEEEDEDEDEDEGSAPRQQQQQQHRHAKSQGSSCFSVFATLVLVAVAVVGGLVFTGRIKLPTAQQ